MTQEITQLARHGWKLFPCVEGDKRPLIKAWQKAASAELAMIRNWEAKYPRCNWGLVTGRQSGVFVLDVDGKEGVEALAALESQYGLLPVTRVSTTGREAGEHRWFKYPERRELRNSAGRLGTGLDIRGAGGYVVVPPSIHPSGRAYQWADPIQPIADPPYWLLDLLSEKAQKDCASRAVVAADPGILVERKRNDGLARYAGALRRKGAELAELEEKLLDANVRRCRPPLEEKDVRKIAASIARYPVGGPDPLELAWRASQGEEYSSNEARFLALCRCLQKSRPGLEIALPLKRIGELIGAHWTTVGDYRKAAVKRGVLAQAGEYVAHRRAGTYFYSDATSQAAAASLTRERREPTLTKPLTTGLVRVQEVPSEGEATNSPSEGAATAVKDVVTISGYKEVLL